MAILPAERLQLVIEVVNESKVVTIEDLCGRLNVSKATVRRDLKELEQKNKLIRTHGGALAISEQHEPPFLIRKSWHIEEKRRIAEAAYRLIKPGEAVILDSGTTAFELAKKLAMIENITVVTNDIIIAMELSTNKNIDLIVIGGKLRKDFYTLTGIFAETVLKNIRVDKYFIGADAVDLEFGLMNYNTEEIPIKKLMIAAAKEKIALCDHSKFESVALANICPLAAIDKIITGQELNPDIHERFTNAGVTFETV
jgi:DeoR/GlpR family transcriptional regulator of sugar metabolism